MAARSRRPSRRDRDERRRDQDEGPGVGPAVAGWRAGGQKIVAATFRHDPSRNLDLLPHTRSVIADTVQDENGKWRTMANEKLYETEDADGAIYRTPAEFCSTVSGHPAATVVWDPAPPFAFILVTFPISLGYTAPVGGQRDRSEGSVESSEYGWNRGNSTAVRPCLLGGRAQ